MLIKSLTVKCEYRFKAGDDAPRYRVLRCRVVDGDAYGTDLFTPNITNVDMAIARALASLPHVETVDFIFDDKIGLTKRRYFRGRFVAMDLVS